MGLRILPEPAQPQTQLRYLLFGLRQRVTSNESSPLLSFNCEPGAVLNAFCDVSLNPSNHPRR